MLLVGVMALTGCSGQDEGSPDEPAQSNESRASNGLGKAVVTDSDGRYHWDGDDLYLGGGAEVQIVGDSGIPARIIRQGGSFGLRVSTVFDRDVTVTVDLGATDSGDYLDVWLPANTNFAVTYDHFEGDLVYQGCWNGTCFGEYSDWFRRKGEVKEFHVSGSGSDPGSGEGEGPVLTLNLVNGYVGSTTVYNEEFAYRPEADYSGDGETEQDWVLAADVLFRFGEATLAPGARDLILMVAEKIPEGASVKVDGHTDSKGDEDVNLSLSQDRAGAVADVLREARLDLTVTDAGHASSVSIEPKERENGQDNPAGRAANRRVEISYVTEE
ncbi:MAG: OmpA family protein [Bifidobacteriaceae bacterium]|jgi:outer membrane protein OmpA-like peptidoglycan-associated protein|nr:OmpA family protein [Bifidobacteriaceae bacterium]